MPGQWGGTPWRTGVGSLAMLGCSMISACRPEYRTPPPPFRDVASASQAELASYCRDAALHFDREGQKDTTMDDGTRLTLVPEAGSQAISGDDLEEGRILAKLKAIGGSGFPELSVKDSACWFAKGRLPKGVLSTFISFKGERLDTFATATRYEKHAKAEVHWYRPDEYGDSGKRSALPVRLASLSSGAPPGKVRALAWSTCTGGYCCAPISNPH